METNDRWTRLNGNYGETDRIFVTPGTYSVVAIAVLRSFEIAVYGSRDLRFIFRISERVNLSTKEQKPNGIHYGREPFSENNTDGAYRVTIVDTENRRTHLWLIYLRTDDDTSAMHDFRNSLTHVGYEFQYLYVTPVRIDFLRNPGRGRTVSGPAIRVVCFPFVSVGSA